MVDTPLQIDKKAEAPTGDVQSDTETLAYDNGANLQMIADKEFESSLEGIKGIIKRLHTVESQNSFETFLRSMEIENPEDIQKQFESIISGISPNKGELYRLSRQIFDNFRRIGIERMSANMIIEQKGVEVFKNTGVKFDTLADIKLPIEGASFSIDRNIPNSITIKFEQNQYKAEYSMSTRGWIMSAKVTTPSSEIKFSEKDTKNPEFSIKQKDDSETEQKGYYKVKFDDGLRQSIVDNETGNHQENVREYDWENEIYKDPILYKYYPSLGSE